MVQGSDYIKIKSPADRMRILLILPHDGTYHYRGFFKRSISYAPLTLTSLAALTPRELGAHIDILDEGVTPPGSYDGKKYDIVGITGTTSAAPRAYALAAYWKARGAHVVFGGSHVTLMPDEALEHGDTVCVGLGERIWPRFLGDYAAGRPGRLYRHEPCGGDLSLPVPRRDLLSVGGYMPVTTVLANRGCVHACEFCSLTAQWGRRGLTRPLEEVVEEMTDLARQGKKRFIFLDPSMYSRRDYACRLFEALIPLRIKWSGLATLNMADDPEFLGLAARSGCKGILSGLESMDERTMPAIGKTMNEPRRYKEQIARLHAKGISVLGCFVLGFDGDTEQGLRRDIAEFLDLGLDVPRFSVLTPFPGTALFGRLREAGRISHCDWSRYDTEQVVFQPSHMSSQTLQNLLHASWRAAYSLRRIARRSCSMPRSMPLHLAVNLGLRFYARKLAARVPPLPPYEPILK